MNEGILVVVGLWWSYLGEILGKIWSNERWIGSTFKSTSKLQHFSL